MHLAQKLPWHSLHVRNLGLCGHFQPGLGVVFILYDFTIYLFTPWFVPHNLTQPVFSGTLDSPPKDLHSLDVLFEPGPVSGNTCDHEYFWNGFFYRTRDISTLFTGALGLHILDGCGPVLDKVTVFKIQNLQ
jgi:hypothetical protein